MKLPVAVMAVVVAVMAAPAETVLAAAVLAVPLHPRPPTASRRTFVASHRGRSAPTPPRLERQHLLSSLSWCVRVAASHGAAWAGALAPARS